MEGDLYPYGYSDASDISIHSLRMEGDTAYPDQTNQGYNFNPLPPHGGRLSYVSDIPSCVTISIHSLRMEGDTSSGYAFPGKYISIHSLRMEGDIYNFDNVFCVELFQSTPSAWRETWCYRKVDKGRHGRVISIHSLRMEGDRQRQRLYLLHVISIHSLRMEGDGVANVSVKVILHFNPLPPHGGRPLPLSSWSAWDTFQSTPSAWRETNSAVFY